MLDWKVSINTSMKPDSLVFNMPYKLFPKIPHYTLVKCKC